MKIVPSILEKDVNGLVSQIKRLSPFFNHFQIDIADGILVPNKTIQIDDIIKHEALNIKHTAVDFHLMVKDYEKEIGKLEKLRNLLKIKNVLIHFSAVKNYQQFNNSTIKQFFLGLVLNPQDETKKVVKKVTINNFPCVQIMSVNPGFQGSPFLPETLKKIGQLRKLGYRGEIFLDGAVNDKTLPLIRRQKFLPDVLCPGSFLTKAPHLEERVEFLKEKGENISIG